MRPAPPSSSLHPLRVFSFPLMLYLRASLVLATGRRTRSRATLTVILPASIRYRLPSETRVAVCLILGTVFDLWQEGEPESSDQSIRLLWLAEWVISALSFNLTTPSTRHLYFTPKMPVVCKGFPEGHSRPDSARLDPSPQRIAANTIRGATPGNLR